MVVEDIVDALKNFIPHLHRYEETAESRFGGIAVSSLKSMRETIELLERRINDLRKEQNDADRRRRQA